ncbi:MAG: cytochrome c [Flavobacteriaceae bacterium]|nr:cytochrome c [Flavobacteriaceae bacterium]
MKFILLYFLFIILFFTQNFKTKEESYLDGKEIYEDFCLRCHMSDGKGSRGIPPLANSDYLLNNINKSIYAIKNGLEGEIVVNSIKYNGIMESQGLDEEEVADVMNYILNSWGNSHKKIITPKNVLDNEKIINN